MQKGMEKQFLEACIGVEALDLPATVLRQGCLDTSIGNESEKRTIEAIDV